MCTKIWFAQKDDQCCVKIKVLTQKALLDPTCSSLPGPSRRPSCMRYDGAERSSPVDIPSSLSFCRMCWSLYVGSRGNSLYNCGDTHEYATSYLWSASRRTSSKNSRDVGGLGTGPLRCSANSLRHAKRANACAATAPAAELCVNVCI